MKTATNSVDGIPVETSPALPDDNSFRSAASDTESFSEEPTTPHGSKRQAQREVFNDFVNAQQRQMSADRAIKSLIEVTSSETIDHISSRIIDQVRDYQQELFERAKNENIIAVLDTGSGKTLIACLLIRHTLEQEYLTEEGRGSGRIICFLANSVHLVQQQAAVLRNNLIETPAVLYGDAKANLWAKDSWDKIKSENKVLVCTPAVLDQALAHSYIDMKDISLLVFDEAHHTKKDHPYSRLIRSYYLKCDADQRPKIFGMTASAVDTKGDIAKTATALEELLHAKIVTTNDGSLLSFAPKPTDVKWIFPRLRQNFSTELYEKLHLSVFFSKELRRGFEFSKKAIRELGPWCSDRAWAYVVGASPNESSGLRRKFEQSKAYECIEKIEERDEKLYALEEAVLLVQQYNLEHAIPTCDELSSKVTMLLDKLGRHFQQQPESRAIVFVEERLKALVLYDCFLKLSPPCIRPGILLGIAGNSTEHTSVKSQEKMLQHFRAGLINLVFATSVADEGLDIPQCNLCVRFDPCKTTIQYMQSRGRARMKGSIFAHMIEEDDFDQFRELELQIDNEDYIKKWCASLAPDRRLGHGTQLAKLLARDEGGKKFQTATGAKCDNSNALLILSRFVASLRHSGAREMEAYEEDIDNEKNLFRYAVRLPANDQCSIKGCRGEWKTNKQLAKRSAAWTCCYLLRQKGHLDDNLDSKYRKFKPENLNARIAVSAKKEAYDMQIKPSLWSEGLGSLPQTMYATIVHFRAERVLRHPMTSLVLLTRSCLPEFPTFPAYVEGNVQVNIGFDALTRELPVSENELDWMTTFTLNGVFADIFNKGYDHEPHMMSYWLAPLKPQRTMNVKVIGDLVDMKLLRDMPLERSKWQKNMAHNVWENQFLCDPLNGKFHYFTGTIAQGTRITDPIQESVPRISQKRRTNIIEFSNSTWTATRKKAQQDVNYDMSQPVLAADLVGTRRNFLESATEKDNRDLIACLIAPEYLEIARVGPEIAASCLIWPAVLHRLESYMITLEAFDKLQLHGIPADLALEAFTKDADNDSEEIQTHTEGKRGMGKNYERLEFIGDSLLKMTTTLAVFLRTALDEEGLHCRRMELICNRTLFNTATSDALKLYRYTRALSFDRTTWYPENLKLRRGRGAQKEPLPTQHPPKTQDLGMKTIADICEAVIGSAVMVGRNSHSDNERFDLGVQAVSKLVQSPDHEVNSWKELVDQYVAKDWSLQKNDPIANQRARLVEEKTGYKFNYPRLLRSAFTHSSDTNSPVPDLQRLEFLGDAILDYVCISWLFESNPDRNPQWLTEHKMAMVTNQFLAALAVTLDFDKFIFVTTAKLVGDIQIYANKVREALSHPNCPKSFWMEIEAPPKALSDLVESYIGALLVDSGFDYGEVEKFFEKHVKHFFEDITIYDSFANRHPTTFLYQKLGREYKCQDFRILDSDGGTDERGIDVEILSGVLIHGKVISDAKGTSARYARVRASKKALALVDGMSREAFKIKFGCNCGANES